ncbi:YesL family protein [Evansella clarkii]|uniref:YesL family protein n=1 Tax=Evansella clarkii TaxID=79879 RepID=UPI00099784FE|nr:DUF624 domain-containing protein [Evansella clarkii]
MSILDSKFYKILDEVTSIVILQFLWMVSCLAVVTIFPATMALFSTSREKIALKSSSVFRLYFKELYRYLWKGNLAGIPAFIVFFSLTYYPYAFFSMDGEYTFYLGIMSGFILVIYILFLLHAVTLHFHIELSFKQLLKNAFLLVFFKPLYTIGMLVSLVAIVVISLYFPILLFLCSFSLISYVSIYFVLKKIHHISIEV